MVRPPSPGLVDRLALLLGFSLVVWGVLSISIPAGMILSGALLVAGVIWRKA